MQVFKHTFLSLVISILFFVVLGFPKLNYAAPIQCADTQQYYTYDCEPGTCKPKYRLDKFACVDEGNGKRCVTTYAWVGCYMIDGKCEMIPHNITVPCDVAGGGGGPGPSYEMITCDPGKYLSCGSDAEATQQNKSFCGYKKTCNKYYFPSSYNFPECKTTPEGNPLYTCRTNCSCCDIGTERTCTLGASYTNTVSLYVGGGDDPVDGVYNQMMKDTCYRDGVKRRNDIVVSITLKRSYTKKDNTEWQDWEQSCRVQNCSCKAPPTPTLTPQNKQRPADGFAKRMSG